MTSRTLCFSFENNLTLSTGCTLRPFSCLQAVTLTHRQGSEVAARRGGGHDAPCQSTSSDQWTALWTALWTEPSKQLGTWDTPLGTWLARWLLDCTTRSCWLSLANENEAVDISRSLKWIKKSKLFLFVTYVCLDNKQLKLLLLLF